MKRAPLEITLVNALQDNYVYLAHEPATGACAVIDPSEAKPVLEALKARGLSPTLILNTHHHWDHVGGNEEIKEATGCSIIGSSYDAAAKRIAGLDRGVKEGESFLLGSLEVRAIEIPGHTLGHVAFWIPKAKAVFAGDTLFSIGCGRLFEGSPGQMWASLSKLKALPDDTLLYCGHEYTLANLKFARSVDPDNEELAEKEKTVAALRAKNLPTVPSALGEEKRLNPFLRADDPAIAKRLHLQTAGPVKVFTELRRRKDHFRSS